VKDQMMLNQIRSGAGRTVRECKPLPNDKLEVIMNG